MMKCYIDMRWIAHTVALASLLVATVAVGQDEPASPKSVETRVRESFEMQMELEAKRIQMAEEKLARIKQRHREKIENAEEYIAKQVAMLTNGTAAPDPAKVVVGEPLPTMVDVSASELAAEGWQLWRKRDLATALVKFRASVAKDKTDANAFNGLGWTLLNMGNAVEAKDAFRMALKIEPTHGAALNGVGQSSRALGNLEASETEFLNATQGVIAQFGEETVVRNGMTASWTSLVDVATQLQHWDVATEWAERYLKHKPDESEMKARLEKVKRLKAKAEAAEANEQE